MQMLQQAGAQAVQKTVDKAMTALESLRMEIRGWCEDVLKV
jgi:hypothetical protein